MEKLVASEGRNTMGGNWEKIFIQCQPEGLTDKVLPGEKLPNHQREIAVILMAILRALQQQCTCLSMPRDMQQTHCLKMPILA